MKPYILRLPGVLVLLGLVFSGFQTSRQSANVKVILESGDVSTFHTHPVIGLKVTYENLKVGDYNSEEAYTGKKVKELNAKESGKGDLWLEKWEKAKNSYWPGRFEELYNKVTAKSGLKCDLKNVKAAYTLYVNVTFIEPGFNVGVASRNAAASFDFNLVKTDDPGVSLARLYLNNVPGVNAMGYDFDTDSRVGECFAKAGKMLGQYVLKNK